MGTRRLKIYRDPGGSNGSLAGLRPALGVPTPKFGNFTVMIVTLVSRHLSSAILAPALPQRTGVSSFQSW
jgi:hypothetical protein